MSKHCKENLLGRILNHIKLLRGQSTTQELDRSHGMAKDETDLSYPLMRCALIRAFEETDGAVLQAGLLSGSTAVVLAVTRQHLIVANTGDSRAVLAVQDDEGTYRAVDLSSDHKPARRDDERDRILQLGGEIDGNWVGPENGALSMSRAIGSAVFKRYLIPTPEVRAVTRALGHRFVVLASDGVWSALDSPDVVATVARSWDRPDHGAAELRKRARWWRSSDNICIVIVDLSEADSDGSSPSLPRRRSRGLVKRISDGGGGESNRRDDGGVRGEWGDEMDGEWILGEPARFLERW